MAATDQSKRQTPGEFYKRLLKLTIGGAALFWATTVAISLLPIAAEYRAAFSNWSMHTVWVGALPAGIIMACGVSYALLRFFDMLPTKDAVQKSALLGCVALVMATILIDLPRSFQGYSDAWYYFFIGILLNAPRFLALGAAIGYLYAKESGARKPV